ncbi:queuosine precursor transporter [Sphingomonas faeni]|uniref:queuosine precursor transporter n=1 Tax=Sphingomonas faeni TaxID=185950 RepID=UPI002412F344|nr:queuosine precursor transporter [Sphingomonas faeni]
MDKPVPAFPRSLFVFSVLYGGMVCIAGVLGVKQVALGPLAVEAGIFGFLLLVVLSSAISELHGQKTATFLVRLGFIPLLVSAALIHLVLALPHDPGMYPPAVDAFPIVVGQSSRMMIAGLISYGISQTLNVLIFSKLSGQVGSGEGKLVWLRGMIASIISQIIDTILFITISFLGERPILGLMEGQMLTKVVLSIVLVPFMITFFVRLGRWLDRA